MKYYVYKFLLNNQFFYVLFNRETKLPVLFPFLYLTFFVKRQASNTQYTVMVAIKQFYQFIYQKHSCSVEEIFDNYGLEYLIDELIGFSHYLTYNLVNISSNTHNIRINTVCLFLKWLNNRYINLRYTKLNYSNTQKKYLRINNKIKTYQRSLSLNNKKTNHSLEYKSFSIEHLEAINTIIYPSTKRYKNTKNPWKSYSVQLRNYLMIKILKDYGLRKSELLSLQTDSFKPMLSNQFNPIDKSYALIISNSDYDPRTVKANIKTEYSYRTLYLTKDDYDLLNFYVVNIRNRQKIPDHKILFISTTSLLPLSVRHLNTICTDIYNKLKTHYFI